MKRLKFTVPLFAVLFGTVLFFTRCFWFGQNGDLVLRNGLFYTGNLSKPQAQALVIRGERILLVGKNEDMERFVGPRTRVLDLNGRFACAGFNDAHVHLFNGGKGSTEFDLSGIASIEEMQQRILKKAWELPTEAWLIGRGWDQSLFPGGVWPDKRYLDVIAPDVPMYLVRICGHVALVNSKALAIAGIKTGIPDPPAGEIVRDPATGEPTGILKEEAMRLVSQYIPALSKEGTEQAVLNALNLVEQYGLTSLQDGSPPDIYPIYEKLLDNGMLKCRISLWFPLDERPQQYRRLRDRYNHTKLRFGLLKGFVDGSMGARTAFFQEPYSDEPSTRGIPLMTQEKLNLLVLRADREGYSIGLHAIGDEANGMALNAYALAQRINGMRDSRHRIEHAQVLTKKDIPRFKELGVIASMQPVHCIEDLPWAEARIGAARARYAYPWRSLLKESTVLAFGSDWPVAPLNPIVGMYAAVTRKDTLGQPLNGFFPQERITIREALDAYTKGSAYAERMEAEKGTLEKDKLADIVVLDQNLLVIPAQKILQTKVVMTICAGKIVYESKK